MGISKKEKLNIDKDRLFVEEYKAEEIINRYNLGIEKRENINFSIYSDGTILPIKMEPNGNDYGSYYAGVLDSRGVFVEESRIKWDHIGGVYREDIASDMIEKLSETAVFCGSDFLHWGHFLVNVIPRLWIVKEQSLKVDKYVIIRSEDDSLLELLPNEKVFLDLLGILDKVKLINIPTKFQYVIVPKASFWDWGLNINHLGETGYYHNFFLDVIETVKQKVLNANKIDTKDIDKRKIFYSKHENGTEKNLENFFKANGYWIVYPEDITLQELILQLHHCESVVCFSGTLQHNMLFAVSGIEVTVLERRMVVSKYQTDIDIIKRLNVTYCKAQYSILPTMPMSNTDMLAITPHIKKYAEYKGYAFVAQNKDDYKKSLKNFLKNKKEISINKYLHRKVGNIKAFEEDIERLRNELPELPLPIGAEKDDKYWINYHENLLYYFNVPYSGWEEHDARKMQRRYSQLIEKSLNSGKNEFLIYPLGINGLLFLNVLRNRYGIEPKAVFDNGVSKYNPKVLQSNKIPQYISENTSIILTASLEECKKEVEKYCDKKQIMGCFSVV